MSEPLTIVVAALVRRPDELLLVEEREAGDPASTWMLPGGVVEPGETPLEALERELAEETGLRLVGRPDVAFMVEVPSPAGPYVAITFACETEGAPHPDDPDGLVLEARWVACADALERLDAVTWYDAGPLRRYLTGEEAPGAVYAVNRR